MLRLPLKEAHTVATGVPGNRLEVIGEMLRLPLQKAHVPPSGRVHTVASGEKSGEAGTVAGRRITGFCT